MFKKILTAALVTSMLILPVSSVGPAGSVEAPASAQTQGYLPGDVPAETDAAESMSPALHALVLAMVNHDVKRFDFGNAALTWEGLYNMLSLYGQMDSRSITELGVDQDELGAPPASIRDRLNYDNVSRSYVVVCGEDNLAQIQVESLTASGDGYMLTGALVYEVENEVLVRFQASLQPRDNMFGFVVSALGEV